MDGLLTGRSLVQPYGLYAHVLAEHLGIAPRACLTLSLGGATACAAVALAAAMLASGDARRVLVVYGDTRASGPAGGWRASRSVIADAVSHPEFEAPFGTTAATAGGLVARRHIAQHGTTLDQLGAVAVAARAFARLNEKALRREPLDIAGTRRSPLVASPLRALDCALISDFAAAVVVTTLEEASALGRKPVRVLGHGSSTTHKHAFEAPDIARSGARESGRAAFDRAGLGPQDVHLFQLYDAFTIHVIVLLEDLGICPTGEGGRFVADGRIGPGGRTPLNTHGGMLSCAHGGSLHLSEAVRQLRGEAGARQVRDARVALVHGVGGTFSAHATTILGT